MPMKQVNQPSLPESESLLPTMNVRLLTQRFESLSPHSQRKILSSASGKKLLPNLSEKSARLPQDNTTNTTANKRRKQLESRLSQSFNAKYTPSVNFPNKMPMTGSFSTSVPSPSINKKLVVENKNKTRTSLVDPVEERKKVIKPKAGESQHQDRHSKNSTEQRVTSGRTSKPRSTASTTITTAQNTGQPSSATVVSLANEIGTSVSVIPASLDRQTQINVYQQKSKRKNDTFGIVPLKSSRGSNRHASTELKSMMSTITENFQSANVTRRTSVEISPKPQQFRQETNRNATNGTLTAIVNDQKPKPPPKPKFIDTPMKTQTSGTTMRSKTTELIQQFQSKNDMRSKPQVPPKNKSLKSISADGNRMTDLELKSHPYSSNKSKVGTNDSANPTRDNRNNPNNDRNNSSDTTQQDHGRKWEPTQRSAGNRVVRRPSIRPPPPPPPESSHYSREQSSSATACLTSGHLQTRSNQRNPIQMAHIDNDIPKRNYNNDGTKNTEKEFEESEGVPNIYHTLSSPEDGNDNGGNHDLIPCPSNSQMDDFSQKMSEKQEFTRKMATEDHVDDKNGSCRLPKLPSHPPPSPPQLEQRETSPKYESLYEEIENDDLKENPNTNSTNHDSLSLQKYIPKYQKKSGDNRHFSPPGYYRTRQQKLEESEHQQSSGDKACSFYEDRIMNKESTDANEGNCATDQCETQSLAPSTLSVDSSSNIDFPIHSGHFQRRFSQSYYESSHLQKFSTLGHSSVFSTSFHHSNPYTTGKFATLTAKAGQKFKKNLTKKMGEIGSKFTSAMNTPNSMLSNVYNYKRRGKLFRNNTIGRGFSPAEGFREHRAGSAFYVSHENLPTGSTVIEMHSKMDETDEEDDDDVIYGDNWSSSDDEQTIEDGQLSNGSKTSAERGIADSTLINNTNETLIEPVRKCSLLLEIEAAFMKEKLLEEQKRKSEMGDEHVCEGSCETQPSSSPEARSKFSHSQNESNNGSQNINSSSLPIDEQQFTSTKLVFYKNSPKSAPFPTTAFLFEPPSVSLHKPSARNFSIASSSSNSDSVIESEPEPLAHRFPDAVECCQNGPTDDDDEAFTGPIYTSCLPQEQPFYQRYMFGEELISNDVVRIPNKLDHDLNSHLKDPISSASTTHITLTSSIIEQKEGNTTASSELDEGNSISDESSVLLDENTCISVRRQSSNASTDSGRGADVSVASNPSLRRERLVAGSIYGSQRSLWCELVEVREAGLLTSMSQEDRKLQEAYFEVITSEASYLRSINFLITNFMLAEELGGDKSPRSIINNFQRRRLFSNINAIKECSERMLCCLEDRLKESIVLTGICDILCEFFDKHFDPYVKYCSNQVYQERQLSQLKLNNPQFVNVLRRIESNKECHGLDMRSFLVLPAQRITRYRLLVYAILNRLTVDLKSHQYNIATRAYTLASQVVQNCNESARRMERIEQLAEIDAKLIYKNSELRKVELVTPTRYVVKSGSLIQIIERKLKTKLNMLQSTNRVKARPIFLFLFSDLLLIAKQKVNGTYVCKDYAQRRFIVTQPAEPHSPLIPLGTVSALVSSKSGRTPHLFTCVLMHNSRGKQVELLLNCESESERERWLSSMRPPTSANPGEKIYERWDCPQAMVIHNYEGKEEDELNLKTGQIIDILRKISDGWYYGEIRTKDGSIRSGWFLSSYVQEIINDHVRANQYRQRYELMQRAERLVDKGRSHSLANGLTKTPSLSVHHEADEYHQSQSSARLSVDANILRPLTSLRRLSNPRTLLFN